MRKGQDLYKKAKKIIPGGNMLLSKRPEMFLPENWPSYFSKAKGCYVWDLDGNKFTDMSIMGIGTNSLGYGNDFIDNSVKNVIKTGNMSTFNCPEEVYLAEKLVQMNPWADMVRFARTGGEANSIAIRIARAACGKDNVAICGYHGWHDWYLSANLNTDDNLSEHLLPGLNPTGVPKNLENSVFPFRYNDYEDLENIVNKNDIGVIKMEVIRNYEPKNNFLKKVRKLASKKNIILIFDECSSGFRETFGGIYQKYEVEPDMIMYGKTIGNGYALTAVLGKRSIMESAQSTFISSTFWTERIGPTAALATLELMEKEKSWQKITKTGKKMQNGLSALASKYNLKINILGIPAMTSYNFHSIDSIKYKTFITQEMLKYGYLASNLIYLSTLHNQKVIDKYIYFLTKVFKQIKKHSIAKKKYRILKGKISHSTFKRLTD